MAFWELTLATTYVLGLKRTYRLALAAAYVLGPKTSYRLALAAVYVLGLKRSYRLAMRAHHKCVPPATKYPRIRDFTQRRRTHALFPMPLNAHKEIIQRPDITAGRILLSNRLRSLLDLARLQAKNIRGTRFPTFPAFPSSRSGLGKPSEPKLDGKHDESTGVGRILSNRLRSMLDRARLQAKNIRGTTPPPSSQSGQVRGIPSPSSQSGQGRPSQPKLDSKNDESKPAQAVRLDECGASSFFSSCASHARGSIGAALRSCIVDGLKLRRNSVSRSLSALTTSGLGWQSVRALSGSLYRLPDTSFPLRSFATEENPPVHVRQSGPGREQQTVLRQDIARLMRT